MAQLMKIKEEKLRVRVIQQKAVHQKHFSDEFNKSREYFAKFIQELSKK